MEEKDIKIIEEFIRSIDEDDVDIFINNVCQGDIDRLKKLLQAYKQDEKVIETMAKYLNTKNYADDICEFRLDVKGRFHKHCYKGECIKCIIDYFRKKCE